jgi:hypothetical protein
MSGKTVGPGGDRRSVTVTFGYPEGLRTLVAKTLRYALVLAEARWGRWQTIESISTPDTIYADVTGATLRRHETNQGRNSGLHTVRSKLEAIGYHPGPEEIGTLRFFREALPTMHRRTRRGRGFRRPLKPTPTAYDDEFGGGQ